jgi:hypothetical protein
LIADFFNSAYWLSEQWTFDKLGVVVVENVLVLLFFFGSNLVGII